MELMNKHNLRSLITQTDQEPLSDKDMAFM